LRRNIEHTVNFYYGLESNLPYRIQHTSFTGAKLKEHILDPWVTIRSTESFLEKEDVYGIYEVEDDFEYLRRSTFYDFFSNNKVDVPQFFRKTISVKRKINELPILKFTNYLMRHGKRYKTLKLILHAMFELQNQYPALKKVVYHTSGSWKDIFIIHDSLRLKLDYAELSSTDYDTTTYGNVRMPLRKAIKTNWFYKTFLLRNLTEMLPIFSFYIYKVDKQVFKNTRGKSGKYTFIWKYVTPYKRPFLVMFWLMKELKVAPGRAINERLLYMLQTFLFKPQSTWMWRVKKFSANYVYRNCRKSLAEYYRTVTK